MIATILLFFPHVHLLSLAQVDWYEKKKNNQWFSLSFSWIQTPPPSRQVVCLALAPSCSAVHQLHPQDATALIACKNMYTWTPPPSPMPKKQPSLKDHLNIVDYQLRPLRWSCVQHAVCFGTIAVLSMHLFLFYIKPIFIFHVVYKFVASHRSSLILRGSGVFSSIHQCKWC